MINVGAIIAWIVAAFPVLKLVLDFTKEGLDATKTAQEVFKREEEPLQLPSADDKAVERARAMADLLRSYALFGFLEYLLWATRGVLLIATFWKMLTFWERVFAPKRQN